MENVISESPDHRPPITAKIESLFRKHLTLEGRYKQYVDKYEKVHGALPKDEQGNIEQRISEMLNRKAKLSFVRDAAIVTGVVCGGIFLYKNGAVITDGFQNIKENMEPLEKKSADSWAEFFRERGRLGLFGELPPGDNTIGGRIFEGGRQGPAPLTDRSAESFIDVFVNKFYEHAGGYATGKKIEEPNYRDAPNSATFALFSTFAHDLGGGVRSAWKRNSKQMAFQYHTKWSSANIEDKRGPICRYDLLAFLPRREGKHFIRQALETPELLEEVFGILCSGLENTTTRIPAENVAFYEGGPTWGVGRILGNTLKIIKPLGHFFGTPDATLR